MKFTLLGTGTSQGIPVIGCNCPACISDDKRDNRLRCSMWIRNNAKSIVIDVGPDFRIQALNNGIQMIDAVLITHEHNDHIIGLDDLRPLMFKSRKAMPIYAEQRVLDEIEDRFKYAFEDQPYPGAPRFELIPVKPGDLIKIGDIEVKVVRIHHGDLPILGFVIQDYLAYFTDTNKIPEESLPVIQGIPVLILDALRHRSHHSHFSLKEAIDFSGSINGGQTFLVHLSHTMGPTNNWESQLPDGIYPSYDGLSFDLKKE